MNKLGVSAIVAILSGACFCANADAKDASALFDKPLKVVHVKLPLDRDNPQAKPEVRCTYYPSFAVKEIDTGEEGADQLSILPATTKPHPCTKANAPDEKIVSPDDWNGYFKGAVGDYVFFDADDGWNGGLGFAVFTPGAKKLFEDVAKDWSSISLVAPLAPAGIPSGRALALRYIRVYGAKCSLGDAHAVQCWQKIEHDTGLDAAMPDCRALYVKEQKRTPQLAKEVLGDPAAVYYDVATTLAANGTHITALGTIPPVCYPQE